MARKRTIPSPLYLRRLRIKNARCFKDVDVSFEKESKEFRRLSVVLGKNGTGKSTLLRALAIGLCNQKEASALVAELAGDFVRVNKAGRREEQAKIIVDLVDAQDPTVEYRITTTVTTHDSGQEILDKTTEPSQAFPWHRIFVCGYGVSRGGRKKAMQPSYSVRNAVLSLFKDDAPLMEPEVVLQGLKLASLEERSSKGEYKKMLSHLRAILKLNPNHKIDISSKGVLIHGPWGAMPFHALGDGYRGTSGWLLDLFAHAKRSERVDMSAGLAGVVLIDEVDEHLHPSWQRSLLTTLKKRFPRVQFVTTTHSPLVVVNCDAEELLVCRLHNAVASIHWNLTDPAGRGADELLRGEWFGLTQVMDDATERLMTKYRNLVRKGASSEDVTNARDKLKQRMGRFVMGPLDELAVEVLAELRDEFTQKRSPDERRRLKETAAKKLRGQLYASKSVPARSPREGRKRVRGQKK